MRGNETKEPNLKTKQVERVIQFDDRKLTF